MLATRKSVVSWIAGVLARTGLGVLQLRLPPRFEDCEGKGWCSQSQLAGSAGEDARAPKPVDFFAKVFATLRANAIKSTVSSGDADTRDLS